MTTYTTYTSPEIECRFPLGYRVEWGFPPLQEKFAAIVEQVEHLREQHQRSKQEAEDLFNVLMQKTFREELT